MLKTCVWLATMSLSAGLALAADPINLIPGDFPPIPDCPENGCQRCCGNAGQPEICSLAITIDTGRHPPRTDLPKGRLRLVAHAPSAAIYTPQGLGFSLGRMISSISEETTAAGAAQQVAVLGDTCEAMTFVFADNVATGIPSGRFSGSLERLVMLNSANQPVLSNPAYYDLIRPDRTRFRFGADPAGPSYLNLISYTSAYGRTGVLSDLGIEVLRDEDHILQQISLNQCFIDLAVLSTNSYEIRFYSPSDRGDWDAESQRYVPTGAPFAVHRIENPDATGETRLRYTKTIGGTSWTYLYSYTVASEQWTLVAGDGLKTESKDGVWDEDGVYRLETRRIMDASSNVVSCSTEKMRLYDFGQRRVESSVGLEPQGTNYYTYYENEGEPGYSQLKSAMLADGSWTLYEYDAQSRQTKQTSPFKDSTPSNPQDGKVTTFGYTPNDSRDTTAATDIHPRQTTVTIAGVVVSRSYYTCYLENNGDQVEIEEQGLGSYGDAGNQRTITIHYGGADANVAGRGELKSVQRPDGSMDSYTYEYGSYTPNSSAPGTFTANTNGAALRTTVVHGTAAQPEGLANQSTKDVTVMDENNNRVLTEQYVRVSGGYERIAWTVNAYDSFFAHLTDTWNSNGTHTSASWGTGCCGKENDTDAQGVQTAYAYDALQRLISQIRWGTNGANDGITTTYTLDAAGRQLVQTISAGGLSLTSSNTYDTAGRLLANVDNAGLTTTYGYNADGRTTTNTLPGGATQITERYLDGQVKSVTGTGVVAQYYDYGVNDDGNSWTCQYTGPNGLNSPVWAKTVQDVFGRTKYVIRPAFGSSSVTNESVYDAVGRLVSSVTADGSLQAAATLYAYDETNGLQRTALDANSNGVINLSGPDRVTDAVTRYAKYGSDWFQETLSIVYAQDNANATTTGVQRVRLTGLGGTGGTYSGVLVSESVALDVLGNASTNQTWVDRTNKSVIQVAKLPTSTQDVVSVSINGRLVSATSASAVVQTYSFDALGRQTSQSQVSGGGTRAVASISHYNALGQVDYTEDAAGHRTTYAYDSAAGRRVSITDPLTNTVYSAYDLQGMVTNTWGATYPVKYAFDEYGRQISMTTYRQENGGGDTTAWLYDVATGLLTNKCYADNQGPSYSYDALGRLINRTWARGVTSSNTYDSLGQLTGISYSDSTPAVSLSYDRLGRQTQAVTAGVCTNSFTYDSVTLAPTNETQASGFTSQVLSRSYDGFGRPVGISLGSDYSVAYGYDTSGRFSSVSSSVQSVSSVVNYSYIPGSDLISQLTNDKGLLVTKSYETNRDLLTSVVNTFSNNPISRFDYVNDAAGRRTQRIDSSSVTNTFGYNARSELTSAVMGTNQYGYAYDPIGNRTAATNNAEALSYVANALNQYASVTSSTSTPSVVNLAYDVDGNLTTNGVWTFTWDAENRLLSVSSNGTVFAQNLYDHQSRRIAKLTPVSTNAFIYDGWLLVSEQSATGGNLTTNSYVWGLDLSSSLQGAGGVGGLLAVSHSSSPDAQYFACCDGNGNITDYVDSNGAVVAHREYDAYGNTIVASGTLAQAVPFWFSSKYLEEESGLYYFGYRYYAPGVGRWLSRDPMEEEGGANLYAICRNNFMINIDLWGLSIGVNQNQRLQYVGKGPQTANYRNHETLWAAVFFQDEFSSEDCACIVSKLDFTGTGTAKYKKTEFFLHRFSDIAQDEHSGMYYIALDLINIHQYHQNWDYINNHQAARMFLPIQRGNNDTTITVVWRYKKYEPCPAIIGDGANAFHPATHLDVLHHSQNSLWDLNEALYPYSNRQPPFWARSTMMVGSENVFTIAVKWINGAKGNWVYNDNPHIGVSNINIGSSGTPGGINGAQIQYQAAN